MCVHTDSLHTAQRDFAVAMLKSVVFKEWMVLLSEMGSSYMLLG